MENQFSNFKEYLEWNGKTKSEMDKMDKEYRDKLVKLPELAKKMMKYFMVTNKFYKEEDIDNETCDNKNAIEYSIKITSEVLIRLLLKIDRNEYVKTMLSDNLDNNKISDVLIENDIFDDFYSILHTMKTMKPYVLFILGLGSSSNILEKVIVKFVDLQTDITYHCLEVVKKYKDEEDYKVLNGMLAEYLEENGIEFV